jgi:hypothetical protein
VIPIATESVVPVWLVFGSPAGADQALWPATVGEVAAEREHQADLPVERRQPVAARA